jgi:hypothetical protein
MTPPAPRYYAVCISNRATSRRGTGWVWSEPFDHPGDAAAEIKAKAAAGDITLGFVVEIGPEGRRVKPSWTWPGTAKRIVEHYLDLEDRLMAGEGDKP